MLTSCKDTLQKIGLCLWIYVAVQFVVSGFLSAVTWLGSLILPGWLTTLLYWAGIFVMIVLAGMTAFLAGMSSTGQKHAKWESTTLSRGIPAYVGGMVLICFVSAVWTVFQTLLQTIFSGLTFDSEVESLMTGTDSFTFWIMLFIIGIAGPVVEELFFRRFVFKTLRPYGLLFAMVTSSLCFSFLHMNLSQGIPVFFFGLIFCWAYETSGSFWLPVLLHVTNNVLACLATIGWLSIPVAVLICVLGAVGLIWLIVRLPRIVHWLEAQSGQKASFVQIFHAPALWLFGIAFLVISLGGLII